MITANIYKFSLFGVITLVLVVSGFSIDTPQRRLCKTSFNKSIIYIMLLNNIMYNKYLYGANHIMLQ